MKTSQCQRLIWRPYTQLYIHSLPSAVNHVCSILIHMQGKNRNQFVAACLLLNYYFTYAKRKTTICVPSQWDTIVFMARRSKPYTVVTQKHLDFKDYKLIAKHTIANCQIDITGARVQWRKPKQLRFTKDNPDKILFRYSFGEYLKTTKCLQLKRRIFQKARLPVSEIKKADLL
jgi:hypothetical protein